MGKRFNITGLCLPNRHYMADVSSKLNIALSMIEQGEYFAINRPRQYGKTTTLNSLTNLLNEKGGYIVLNSSFEGIGDAIFEEEATFSQGFVEILAKYTSESDTSLAQWLLQEAPRVRSLKLLELFISEFLNKTPKKVVLLIDEVDKSSNNQLFVSFLAMLRNKYLENHRFKTFHSVVLSGLHDVKTLKIKLRPDSEKKLNSPWNIATDFNVDMTLNPQEIKSMLDEYVADKKIETNTEGVAERLFYYTSGYPFLVSKLCKMYDEEILPAKTDNTWTNEDIDKCVKKLIGENNTNFDSLTKNIEEYQDLYALVYRVAVDGEQIPFNIHNQDIHIGILHGIFRDGNGHGLKIHNRIYNEVLLNYMSFKVLLAQPRDSMEVGMSYKNNDDTLNMQSTLLGFQAFLKKEYSKKDRDFIEKQGRLVFLAFMKPIINGKGFDFKEVQISEERRLDVVITYMREKFVAELKIWRGEKAHAKGLKQLCNYLDIQGLDEGFLLIFDHSEVKKWDSGWVETQGKRIFIAWV